MIQRCTNCIMSMQEDPNIVFGFDGVCNYCDEYKRNEKERWLKRTDLPWIIHEIKEAGKGKKYDCLLGLSGGVDSSMCLHYLLEHKLRPLCFSVDNGWNTPESDENIMRMVETLKVPFFRYDLNLAKFYGLQVAFVRSGLKNIEVPTDHVLMAATYEVAKENGIKWIISGGNLATEGIMPTHFGYNAKDLTHVRGVYKAMTGKKLTGLPTISLLGYLWNRFIKKIRIVNLLDYYEYNREEAIKVLSEKYGYKPYGEKHGESRFTKWFQNTYLIRKFGLDKRVPHYSSLINSKQMKREDALALTGVLPIEEKSLDGNFDWRRGRDLKNDYKDYPNSEYWWNLLSKWYKKFK